VKRPQSFRGRDGSAYLDRNFRSMEKGVVHQAVLDGLVETLLMLFDKFDGRRHVDYKMAQACDGLLDLFATDRNTGAFGGEPVFS